MLLKCMAITGVITVAFSTAVFADKDTEWKIKAGIRYQEFDKGRLLEEEDPGGSLSIEYRTGHWGTELEMWHVNAEEESGRADVNVNAGNLNLYRYFNQGSDFEPYVVTGMGHGDYDGFTINEKGTQASLGLGFQHRLNRHVSWWMDARGVHELDESHNDTLLGVGIAYHFGGGAEKPEILTPAKPVDSDNDGVSDTRDECPDTSPGSPVDDKGCDLDSDADGVPNYRDQCPDTKANTPVDKQGCALKSTQIERIHLSVLFETGSATIRSGFIDEISDLAEFMKRYPDLDVVIEGHTDSTGPQSLNKKLSLDRAESVKQVLVNQFKIDALRVFTKGFGPDEPIATNDTEQGRRKNRRVVAVLEKKIIQ